jgi:hypothetical protein
MGCHKALLAAFFVLKMEATCSSEFSVDFSGLYGTISEKKELFIANSVGFGGLTIMTMKGTIFLDVITCNPLEIY